MKTIDADLFREELAFWDRELSLRGDFAEGVTNRLDPERMHLNFPREILPFVNLLKAGFAEPVRVIDVGSGPLSMLAWGARQGWYELECVDPLAVEYLNLLTKHGHIPPWRLTAGFGEELMEKFGPDSFHLVWSNNALDHTQAPRRVLENFAGVLKPRGLAAIQLWEDEGSAQGWNGLHQHDFRLGASGELLHRMRAAEYRPVADGLNLELVESVTMARGERKYLRVVLRRVE